MSAAETEGKAAPSKVRRLGQIAQGLFLGPLLVLAIIKLVSLAGDLLPFRYQGF